MSADAQEGERLGVGGLPIHGGLTPVTEDALCYFNRRHGAEAEVDDRRAVPMYRDVVAAEEPRRCGVGR
jgi:hypothetical protein